MPTADDYIAACRTAEAAFDRLLSVRKMMERMIGAMTVSPNDAWSAIDPEWPDAAALRSIIEDAVQANMAMQGLWHGMSPQQQRHLSPPLRVPSMTIPE